MVQHKVVALGAIAALSAGVGSSARGSTAASAPRVAARPPAAIDPAGFVRHVDNPWFPLPPGRTLRYRGQKDGVRGTDVLAVTHRTRRILGVTTTVVHDRVLAHGRVTEDTLDYYAQDRHGTVWYFGEDTKELDRRGRVTSREGTWRAGVNGARAGIFMPGRPRVGQAFRQELLKGHAEDHFRIISLHATAKVPALTSHRAMKTHEWTPLEPGVLDVKLYARGLGTVLEQTVKGGNERWALASVTG